MQRTHFAVQWKPSEKISPVPLKDLELDKGNWIISPLYIQIGTAKSWGLTPYEFFELSEAERLLMIGYDLVEKKMQAYEQQWYEEQRPKT